MRGKNTQSKNGKYDSYSIWITIILLTSFGLIMVYSASGVQFIGNKNYNNNSMYLFEKQLEYVIFGFIACFILQYLDYTILYKLSFVGYITSVICIVALKTPLGITVKGATRWLNLAGIQFQVAEVVKIATIISMAYMIERFSKHLKKIQLVLLMWGMGGFLAILLLLISNDLSSSVIVLGITFGITFVYTRQTKLHLISAGGVLAAAAFCVWLVWRDMPTADELEQLSFRIGRIAAWLEPERYASSQGYQPLQALYAIGSGGFFGKGLGNSVQKIQSIPEAQNDMIFSIICEELGVLGASMMIFLYGYLCWQLYKTAVSATTIFGSVLATGVLVHIGLQSFVNIAVNVNLLPNTGIGLPFISYGGTAVLCQLVEMAMVFSVGRVIDGKGVFNPISFARHVEKTRKRR